MCLGEANRGGVYLQCLSPIVFNCEMWAHTRCGIHFLPLKTFTKALFCVTNSKANRKGYLLLKRLLHSTPSGKILTLTPMQAASFCCQWTKKNLYFINIIYNAPPLFSGIKNVIPRHSPVRLCSVFLCLFDLCQIF